MPRYFFSTVLAEGSATDLVGDECRNLAEARERARQEAMDLVSTQLQCGGPPSGWIEVEDEEHRPLFMLPLSAVAS
jgi:hypothetical protein